MMNHTRNRTLALTLAIALCITASALTVAGRTPKAFLDHSVLNTSRTERVTIAIEGMHCESCAAGIRVTLKRTSGVISAEVSYQSKEAIVEYDPEKITPSKIVETINNLGYKAKIKS